MSVGGMDEVHMPGFVGEVAAAVSPFEDFHSARILLGVRVVVEVVARVGHNQLVGVEMNFVANPPKMPASAKGERIR